MNSNWDRWVERNNKAPRNADQFDIGYGHLGNGISVWNRKREIHGDYEKIAHISIERKVEFYGDVPASIKNEIELFAATENPQRSTCQPEGVFQTVAT